MNRLSSFIKYQRKKLKLSQQDLASKAGVGLRFIRDLEQGKVTLQLDKVRQVLSLFGFDLIPGKPKLDAYNISWNYFNKPVKITLIDKTEKYGFIIDDKKKENEIVAWKFISNNNAIKYQRNKDEHLVEVILHSNIADIELRDQNTL